VIIGEGDLSQDLGYPGSTDHPTVASAIDEILAICKQYDVACGHPHVDSKNVEALLEKGFRYLMPARSTRTPLWSSAARRAAARSSVVAAGSAFNVHPPLFEPKAGLVIGA